MEQVNTTEPAEVVEDKKLDADSPYAMFETNVDVEKTGVVIDYGPFSIRIARAGGSNGKYAKQLEKSTKPFKRIIDKLNVEQERQIWREVYAKSIVISWENVKDKQGNVIPFNVTNCIRLFTDLPDLLDDLKTQANTMALFMEDITEGDLGN